METTTHTTIQLQQTLKQYFGYDTFREHQEDIINHVLSGKDALVIMPTGGGKSLCYQMPALVSGGLALVISPLIALMTDQVLALKANGVSAGAVNSAMTRAELDEAYYALESSTLRLLYVSPEKVLTARFLNYLKTKSLSLIAIDEAHCVSIWGNDFRPEYAKLTSLLKSFPSTPVLALTATADKATQKDIAVQLGLREPKLYLSSFERKNIHISILPGQRRIEQIERFLIENKDAAGIIYCLSRRSTEEVSAKLRGRGYKAEYYHAKVPPEDRRKVQEAFQHDEIQIVCATIAFGMGIDKANIRWVIHYNMPRNVESYYQEIGRSGRDGDPAHVMMFYSFRDVMVYRDFIASSEADAEFKNVQRQKLDRIWELTQATSCRTNVILNYFGEYRAIGCGHCDHCKNPPQGFDGTVIAQKALSACKRAGEKVGVYLLVDILRGSLRQEVRAGGYDHIKTFGAGSDISKNDWVDYITQMMNLGLLEIDYTKRSQLALTPLSTAVLHGEKVVTLHRKGAIAKTPPTLKKEIVEDYDEKLFVLLKELRLKIAHGQGVPAFVIFADRTLREIAGHQPTTMQEFNMVHGVGTFKAEKYGEIFIEVVNNFKASE